MNFEQSTKTVGRAILSRFGYELVRKVSYKRLNINYPWLTHFMYFKELFDLIKDVDGDIVECGVGAGHSFFKLCSLASYEERGRKIYGFDSFEGFPEPSIEDASPRNPQKGEWNVATTDTIKQLLMEAGEIEESFLKSNVRLVKGFFEDSLDRFDGKDVAFLHLDVDLYQSYKVTLEYFWPRLKPGGVVLFDEYKQTRSLMKFPGASKAIDEFFGPLAEQIRYNRKADRYYLVKPK